MKNKTIAMLLAFFVGWFGIHKFYLGKNFAGVMYLMFSWSFIPAVLAFFDFLGLAMTPDAVFDAQYNPQALNSAMGNSLQDRTKAMYELKRLYESGVITAEEYEQKRRKILDSI